MGRTWVAVGLAGALVGCGTAGDDAAIDAGVSGDAPATDAPSPDADPGEAPTQYVVNFLDVATSPGEAYALGLDIDGDPMMRPDNALGQMLSTFAVGAPDLQALVDGRIAAGSLRELIDIQAVSLVDATGVGVRLFVGEDGDVPADPTDDFSGSERFVIAPGTPTDGLLEGDILGGALRVGPGTTYLQLVLTTTGDLVVVTLVGARVEASVSPTGTMSGKIGGGLTQAEVDTVVVPEFHNMVVEMIEADCSGGVCTPGSRGESMLDLFDDDGDGTVTLVEVAGSAFLQSLLAPDLDLFDAVGDFNPRVDGVKDSLSLGVGFTAVGATFALP